MHTCACVHACVCVNVTRRDLKEVKVSEKEWCEEARRSRPGWRAMCRLGMEEMMETQRMKRAAAVMKEVVCQVCRRKFSREGDRKRHECREERRKPVRELRGAAVCGMQEAEEDWQSTLVDLRRC